MPFSEENVLDFVKWLEKSYFVERALEGLKSFWHRNL